ncbi:MAG: SMC-Scp complex subunit ScpB [Parcubacteria group bacterium]|jgi:segregation and condensation protein B
MDENNLKSIIESLLFVSGEPLKLNRLAKICSASKAEIQNATDQLKHEYEDRLGGLMLMESEDSLQLVSASRNSAYVRKLVDSELNTDLSRAALEVLSIIAYRGPITRSQVEAIRGVNCSYVLRSLLLRGLVEREETNDIRRYVYKTSFDFLKVLGISNSSQLPDWDELSKNEKINQTLAESIESKAEGEAETAPVAE